MKILITGGTGRIGANLGKRLLEKGHTVRNLVFPGDAGRAHKLDGYEGVETVVGDLRDIDDVRPAVDGVDAIYHLAAAFGGPFDNIQYLNINAMGTLNLLEYVRTGLPDLHRLVYASTEAVYWRLPAAGRYFEDPITEEMVSPHHQMPYFLTKWVGEELCMAYHLQYGTPSTVFRFSTVIEPGEFLNDAGLPKPFLLSTTRDEYEGWSSEDPAEQGLIDAVRALSTGEERLLLSQNPDGSPYKQHFSDVRDIVQGLVLGIEKDAAVGEVFNLAGAALFDWAETVDFLAGRYGLGTVEARLPYPNYFELDLAKIQKLLGYRPEHDLVSILDTAEAMRRGEDTGVIPTGVRFDGLQRTVRST
jgi:dTDP-L-rhamnose 4-epimerase